MNIPYLKSGDPFNVPIRLLLNGAPVEVTDDMQFAVRIIDQRGQTIAEPTATPYANQSHDANKGFVLLQHLDTASWKPGIASYDIKVTINGAVRHTMTLQFAVQASITP